MKLGHTEKPRVVIDTNIVISAPKEFLEIYLQHKRIGR